MTADGEDDRDDGGRIMWFVWQEPWISMNLSYGLSMTIMLEKQASSSSPSSEGRREESLTKTSFLRGKKSEQGEWERMNIVLTNESMTTKRVLCHSLIATISSFLL